MNVGYIILIILTSAIPEVLLWCTLTPDVESATPGAEDARVKVYASLSSWLRWLKESWRSFKIITWGLV